MRFRSLLLAVPLLAPSFLSAQSAIDAPPRYEPVARALAGFVQHERAQKGIPGISVALVEGGRIVYARGFGWADSAAGRPATAATVYRVGSVSKLFTDIGIMRLVEQGKLDLDRPIQAYLPAFHPKNPFGGAITIRELTSHRAGLTREPPVGNYFDDTSPTLAATVASLNGTSLVYKPGTRTKYSNAGIAVLGYLLEKTQGESFYPYLKRAVLEPMGLEHSAFQPLPAFAGELARGTMWTVDERRFDAPTFQLGMGPCGSMYTTVTDLGRFLSILFARGRTPEGTRILKPSTLDTMWTPQYAPRGARSGYGIGFGVGSLDGHRMIGHDGAIYGFATTLLALPDDSVGAVVVATLDVANAVTDRIAQSAARMLLAARAGRPLPLPNTTRALEPGEALRLAGRYGAGQLETDLTEYEGRLFLRRAGGDEARLEVRRLPDGGLVTDDVLGYGLALKPLPDGIALAGVDLPRVPQATTPPPPAPAEYAGLIGEYGWDHDVLYILERDGQLTALIEWAFEYPLQRVAKDVYRFPARGLYDGQEIRFEWGPNGANGKATVALAANVAFRRRPLPGDNDAVSFRITPVRPVAELRQEALKATPPKETGDFRQPDLVELRSLDPSIRYEIRYATSNNFLGTPMYTSAHAFMQRPAAEAVARASAELHRLGYGLLIHDSYRPWYVTKMFWDATPPDKHVFVADPSEGSRHNRGCAVDLTLYDLKTGQPIRMTGGYDEMSDRSYPLYPGGTSNQRWQRDLLRRVMEAQGFTVYEAEWWHFDYRDWRHYPILNLTFEELARAASR